MNIHEYQAKDLLRRYGVPVPNGALALSVEEAVKMALNCAPLPVVRTCGPIASVPSFLNLIRIVTCV